MERKDIRTMEDLAQYINECEEWKLNISKIIAEHGWQDDTADTYGICHDVWSVCHFDENGDAVIKPNDNPIHITDIVNAQDAFWQARRNYVGVVSNFLKQHPSQEFKLDNGYGEEDELLEICVVDDNGTGVDRYGMDKIRWNEEEKYPEVHVCYHNDYKHDYWLKAYMLGSEETYVYENILI